MGKVLITLTPAQEEWVREEARRRETPGGMSGFVRQLIDRERGDGARRPSIPEEVLMKIVAHRPHLQNMVNTLRAHPAQAVQIEKAIAVAYLAGETRLSPLETWNLAACSIGRAYGEGA